MNDTRGSFARPLLITWLIAVVFALPGCYQYRVLTTKNDPSTEYKETVLQSYAWGLWLKSKDYHVMNCDSCGGIDEVTFGKSAAQSLLTLITLGIVSKTTMRWKCHKLCPRIDSL